MFVIKPVEPKVYFEHLRQWAAFRPGDPVPRDLSIGAVFLDLCSLDYEPIKTLGFFQTDLLLEGAAVLGGTRIYSKQAQGMTIGGIGRMAVKPDCRRNGIASYLMEVSLIYMFKHKFDISVLWASVLELYENFGYVPLTRDGKETNMMYRPIHGLPIGWTKQCLLDLPAQIGTW